MSYLIQKEKAVYKGTVESFDEISGCGVIKRENGDHVPVHVSAIRNSAAKTLQKGEVVIFDIGRGKTGLEVIYAMLFGNKITGAGSATAEGQLA